MFIAYSLRAVITFLSYEECLNKICHTLYHWILEGSTAAINDIENKGTY